MGGNANNIKINFDNFPYYGHSYNNADDMKIKVCKQFDDKIGLIMDDGTEEIIEIKIEDDFEYPIEKKELLRTEHSFKIELKEGKFDFEYILYDILNTMKSKINIEIIS